MSYLTQSEIAANPAMYSRVAQCATEENVADAETWTHQNRREWAAAPGWDAAWTYAKETHPPEPPVEGQPSPPPYDPGSDEAVITDAMILSQVQSMTSPTSTREEE